MVYVWEVKNEHARKNVTVRALSEVMCLPSLRRLQAIDEHCKAIPSC